VKPVTRLPTPKTVLTRLARAFRRHLGLGRGSAGALLRGARLYDKAYELSSMLEMLDRLKAHQTSLTFRLVQGRSLIFRGKGGPIQRSNWPFIRIRNGSQIVAEVWVDIECMALSYSLTGKKIQGRPYAKAHELDVVVIEPDTSEYPRPEQIYLGLEAKHRLFNKALLKELLGVRREMTFRSSLGRNRFAWWSGNLLPADPCSGLLAFCSNANIAKYQDLADFWGIKMIYHPG
jgi:hypothetical protein